MNVFVHSNIFRYEYSYNFFDTNIFGNSFVLFFIRIYSDIRSYHFLIRIYSDIRSYCFLIRIYSREKSNVCANRSKIVHTQINIQRKITSILLCQLCFNFLLYHTSKIQLSNIKSKT